MALRNPQTPAEILSKALTRKKKAFPQYSQRALARDLGLSNAFLAKTLTGEKILPAKHIAKVTKVLAMDPSERQTLTTSILFHKMKSPELKALIREGWQESKLAAHVREDATRFTLLQDWYNVAVLDLATTEGFKPDAVWMARRLSITPKQALLSFEKLIELGALKETSPGVFEKADLHTAFPTARSKSEVRAFHSQMIAKAQETLKQTKDSDFDRRLITGVTTALNHEQLDQLKKMIFEFMGAVSQTATEGVCNDVYQMNVQLFPLTKDET